MGRGTSNKYRGAVVPTSNRYSLVEVDMGEPVEEAATKLMEFDEPSTVDVPADTEFELFVVYDREGNEVTDGIRAADGVRDLAVD